MFTVRITKRECTDQGKIDRFLAEAQVGYLGMSAGGVPYVVPMNYAWLNGAVYIHGAEEGKRAHYLRENDQVCFAIGEHYGTMTSPVPGHTDTAYMSVVMNGAASFLTDWEEATEAMQCMLNKYVPGFYDKPLARSHVEKYRSSLGGRTAIIKIVPSEITAKENTPVEDKLFRPGAKLRE